MNLKEMRVKQPIGYKLEAKPGKSRTKVYLYGDIVDEVPINWWTGEPEPGDFITPDGVRSLVDGIDGDIELHLNSYGGSVFASVAIANQLRSSGKHIDLYVDGIAASGGSIIAMAGDSVKMYPGSMMMIHKAWGVVAGNSDDMRKQAETLDKVDLSVIANYAGRYKGTAEELFNMVTDETWITAEEAVEMGFADEIIHGKEPEALDDAEKEPEAPMNSSVEQKESVNKLLAFADAAFLNAKNRRK